MPRSSPVRTINPKDLRRNPENPRLIFRTDDLQALEDSIKSQGILVPLTVYEDGSHTAILDGERRWRCALKLGLRTVPVIVQPKPDRLQNIMMMFAIHHARTDWDPLPTAYKLRDLENVFARQNKRAPTESELAELASMSRGEVRRLKKLLGLPEEYQEELMSELEKPRHEQVLTVDHVLEATKGAEALRRRNVVTVAEEDALRKSLVSKFRNKVLRNTTDPRMLARIARSVERGELPERSAKTAIRRLIREPTYSIEEAFADTAAGSDFAHATEQLADRLTVRLRDHQEFGYDVSDELRTSLTKLRNEISRLLRS